MINQKDFKVTVEDGTMSNSNSLNEVVDGEDSETESESDENNAEEFEIVETKKVKETMMQSNIAAYNKSVLENEPKKQPKIVKKPQNKPNMQTQYKPQFKEIKARSKFDIMRSGFGKMIKSTKKMVEKNFKPKKRSKWENAIYDATMLFHEKTLKAASFDLNAIKKESDRTKSDCQQSVNDLHQSTIRINKANNNLKSFCTDTEQYKLKWMFEI